MNHETNVEACEGRTYDGEYYRCGRSVLLRDPTNRRETVVIPAVTLEEAHKEVEGG